MKNKKKFIIKIIIVVGLAIILLPFIVMFSLMMIFGGNSPASTELANEIGEPLSIDEAWNE